MQKISQPENLILSIVFNNKIGIQCNIISKYLIYMILYNNFIILLFSKVKFVTIFNQT